jgi:HK97 family phage prohead protease
MTTKVDAPREDLIRMTPGPSLRQDEDGALLVGYAAVFNEWTEIDSWEGKFLERIAPGAFRKTLQERGDKVKVLFNHGMDPSIGDKPLGRPRVMKERTRGLYVEVPLDDTSYNSDIKALLRSGALDGMSFRMTVVAEEWNLPEDELPERTIKEIRLYEFGPVTFPAYEATEAGVRAHAPSAFEAWRSHRITAPTEGRDESAGEHATDDVTQRDESAGDDATDATESEPDGQSTRSEEEAPPEETSDYTPAQRTPLSPERRQAQKGMVAAFLAHTSKE